MTNDQGRSSLWISEMTSKVISSLMLTLNTSSCSHIHIHVHSCAHNTDSHNPSGFLHCALGHLVKDEAAFTSTNARSNL